MLFRQIYYGRKENKNKLRRIIFDQTFSECLPGEILVFDVLRHHTKAFLFHCN